MISCLPFSSFAKLTYAICATSLSCLCCRCSIACWPMTQWRVMGRAAITWPALSLISRRQNVPTSRTSERQVQDSIIQGMTTPQCCLTLKNLQTNYKRRSSLPCLSALWYICTYCMDHSVAWHHCIYYMYIFARILKISRVKVCWFIHC